MADQFQVQDRFAVTPHELYRAWLDSAEHGAMTGSGARIDPRPGGLFTAWDGYISGTTIELVEDQKIVQSWRTTEFGDSDEDSRLEIVLTPEGDATLLTLRHTEIPGGQGEAYKQGWTDHYFNPMHEHLG